MTARWHDGARALMSSRGADLDMSLRRRLNGPEQRHCETFKAMIERLLAGLGSGAAASHPDGLTTDANTEDARPGRQSDEALASLSDRSAGLAVADDVPGNRSDCYGLTSLPTSSSRLRRLSDARVRPWSEGPEGGNPALRRWPSTTPTLTAAGVRFAAVETRAAIRIKIPATGAPSPRPSRRRRSALGRRWAASRTLCFAFAIATLVPASRSEVGTSF